MKNLTIGKRLYAAFGIMILLVLILSGGGIYQLKGVTHEFDDLVKEYQPIGEAAEEIEISLLTMRRHEKDYMARKKDKYLAKMDKAHDKLHHLSLDLAAKAEKLGLDHIAAESKKIEADLIVYEKGFNSIVALIKAQGNKDTGIRGAMRKEAHGMETAIKAIGSDALMVHYLMMRRHEKDFILREDNKYIAKSRKVLDKIDAAIDSGNFESDAGQSLVKHAKGYVKMFAQLAENVDGIKKEYPAMRAAAHDIEKLAHDIFKQIHAVVETKVEEADHHAESTINFAYIFCGFIVLTGILLGFFAVRSITKPLHRAISSMNEGAEQVASASGQVSSSSQQLAAGTSEQAASIEETSASLEEMSSMTKQNADNAGQADGLMKEAADVVTTANDSMGRLTTSMADISKASEETSKIIKTIDEIAFQTNLLALNAAVEAARAGEAGAGFAVVADEVRNLAMRAADAAKDTAVLIEDTVKKIGEGSTLVETTNGAFVKVSESAAKVGELVSEIAAASGEQADGIEQVNRAVVEMDKVVQQNAASAEESASASEEMSAQAEQMRSIVSELQVLTGTVSRAQDDAKDGKQSVLPESNLSAGTETGKVKMLTAADKHRPEDIIPLDEDEDGFKDF